MNNPNELRERLHTLYYQMDNGYDPRKEDIMKALSEAATMILYLQCTEPNTLEADYNNNYFKTHYK